MANKKKSFILYADLIHTVRKMPIDKAGELFLTILQYVNDENPVVEDIVVDLVFEPIKRQIERDKNKWEQTSERRSEAGKSGGIKSGETRRKKYEANASSVKQSKTNEAVNVNDTVNVSESVKSNNSTPNRILGLNYRLPYEDTNDEFKKLYDKPFYDSWLSINAYLDENCTYLRNWDNQITIAEYKKIYVRISKKDITIIQVKQALSDLDGSRVAKERYNSVFHGFNTFLKTILKGQYV